MTDSTGAVTKNYDYDAFGNECDPDEEDTNPFRYCGEYFDKETGAYHLRARYYDPLIGRFTQTDTHWNTANMIYGDNPQKINEREDALGLKTYSFAPQISAVMQSGNLYVYGVNNPVLYFDPTGNVSEMVMTWTGSMWWLTAVDGFLPIGDTIYVVGIGIVAIGGAISYASNKSNKVSTSNISGASSSPMAPLPPDDDDNNWISKGTLKHILNKHMPKRAAQKAQFSPIKTSLEKISYFDASWSEATIVKAIQFGYLQALKAGIKTGEYIFEYAGQQICIYLKNGSISTAYGYLQYTVEQLLELLG